MPRFAPGVWRFGLLPTVAGLVAAVVWLPAGVALLALAGGVFWFHRDPDRNTPDGGLIAPADGTVKVVCKEDDRLRVGTFMNLHHVHVVRAPWAGRVEGVTHEPGGHWPAFTKAAERNERLRVALPDGEVVMVAGTVARRTDAYVGTGDRVGRGERLGHISFSSRVDVVFPPWVDRADLAVSEGDRVRAGETRVVEASALARDAPTPGAEPTD